MTVTFVRSGLMLPGKFAEGQQFVQNRIKWLKESFGIDATMMAALGGQVGRIALVTQQDSVAQIEDVRRQLIGGALPKELATGQAGVFMPGQTKDRIWLEIS